MKANDAKVLILGIGNVLMGDEGVGSLVAQYISGEELPENVTCIDAGTGGFQMLGDLSEADEIFLIDAVADGKEKGTISKLHPKYSSDYPKTLTAHEIGLKDMIDALYMTSGEKAITLFTVSIDSFSEMKYGLCDQLNELIPVLGDKVINAVVNN